MSQKAVNSSSARFEINFPISLYGIIHLNENGIKKSKLEIEKINSIKLFTFILLIFLSILCFQLLFIYYFALSECLFEQRGGIFQISLLRFMKSFNVRLVLRLLLLLPILMSQCYIHLLIPQKLVLNCFKSLSHMFEPFFSSILLCTPIGSPSAQSNPQLMKIASNLYCFKIGRNYLFKQ